VFNLVFFTGLEIAMVIKKRYILGASFIGALTFVFYFFFGAAMSQLNSCCRFFAAG
jgi:hypothetical protein